jgi:hypothetical protein
MPWIGDKKKNGDMMFAVRATYVRKKDGTPVDSGLHTFMSINGARRRAAQIVQDYEHYKDSGWFSFLLKKVEIKATMLDWQTVEIPFDTLD